MSTAAYGPRPEHHFVISIGHHADYIAWYWVCTLHRGWCEHHMKVFMKKYIHRDKQSRLI